ncbi:Beta-lactamase domain-containing protein, partial [Durusdinium trenchii]
VALGVGEQAVCEAPGSNSDLHVQAKLALLNLGSCSLDNEPYGGAAFGYSDFETGVHVLDGVGWAREGTHKFCPYETIQPWASISKSVTGVIAANLAAEGLLDLDVDIGEYLNSELYGMTYNRPQFFVTCSSNANPDGPMPRDGCPDGDTVGSQVISFEEAFISTRMLLAHRAGYGDWGSSTYILTWQDNQLQWIKSFNRPPGRLEEINHGHNMTWSVKTGNLHQLNLAGKPGAGYLYSNHGYAVLIASGLSYDELVDKYISKRLGIKTLHTLRENTDNGEAEAFGYGDSVLTNCQFLGFTRDAAWHASGGGHASTLEDLHKYAVALATFDARLLPTMDFLNSLTPQQMAATGYVMPAPGKLDAMSTFWEHEVVGAGSLGSTFGYAFGINRWYTRNVNTIPADPTTHWQFLSQAIHGGSWTTTFTEMAIHWRRLADNSLPGAANVGAKVFTVLSNARNDRNRTGTNSADAVKAAMENAVANGMSYTESDFLMVAYGRDKNDPLCSGCASGYREWRTVSHVTPTAMQRILPDMPNHPIQNEPLTFDLVWENGEGNGNNCNVGSTVDAVLDPKGLHSQITEVDKVLNPGIGGFDSGTTNPPDTWLVDNYNQFTDNAVEVQPYSDRWTKFKTAGFFPLQIQGNTRTDGVTCFLGTWARKSTVDANDFSIQRDVKPSDVDLHGQGKIPTSVSVYYDPNSTDVLSTVVWRQESEPDESKSYWIPRVGGSTALTFQQFDQFYEANFERCTIVEKLVDIRRLDTATGGTTTGGTAGGVDPPKKTVEVCECWMPVLIDAYSVPNTRKGDLEDRYMSVWKRVEVVNGYAKVRIPEAEFQDLVRKAACDGYKVKALTRYRVSNDIDDGFYVAAIFEQEKCFEGGDIAPPNTLDLCRDQGVDGFLDKAPSAGSSLPSTDARSLWNAAAIPDPLPLNAEREEHDFAGGRLEFLSFDLCPEKGNRDIQRCDRGKMLTTDHCNNNVCVDDPTTGASGGTKFTTGTRTATITLGAVAVLGAGATLYHRNRRRSTLDDVARRTSQGSVVDPAANPRLSGQSDLSVPEV